jgi:hypothetical protein
MLVFFGAGKEIPAPPPLKMANFTTLNTKAKTL